MTPEAFKQFIADNMAHNHVEAEIVRRTVEALAANDTPVIEVYDGVEYAGVETLQQINELVFNLDECFLVTEGGDWVRITLGNDWDAITDYTVDLEDALAPVNDWIDKHN